MATVSQSPLSTQPTDRVLRRSQSLTLIHSCGCTRVEHVGLCSDAVREERIDAAAAIPCASCDPQRRLTPTPEQLRAERSALWGTD